MNAFDAIHIERVAEALWQFDSEHAFGHVKPWDEVPAYSKDMYRGMAQFAVAAFLRPVEPTQSTHQSSENAPRTVGRPSAALGSAAQVPGWRE